jgi:glycosyltransferase involved in cell wall biosynthesis
LIDPTDPEEVWLALSVMTARLPYDRDVVEIARESEFDGGAALAAMVIRSSRRIDLRRTVRVAEPTDVVVDIALTLATAYVTGIQRVVRETVARWAGIPDARLVSWTDDLTAVRSLDSEQAETVNRWIPDGSPFDTRRGESTVIVPWRCTFLSAELSPEVERNARLRSLARFARCNTGAIAYDCVPITSSETRAGWRGETFATYLAALAQYDRLAPISAASAIEFRGWRAGLAAVGIPGPSIEPVVLPDATIAFGESALETVRSKYLFEDMPMILVVGSHEPRKNHSAVLHAAELVWRRGLRFTLMFIGGRSWESDPFFEALARLQGAGRPVGVASAQSDAELAAAYQLARFTVFPSLNEGFGLPVAESLTLGTPVITSNFGSMQEIADGGGALTVDPRSDHAIADAIERLLTDDDLLADLEAAAHARPRRTWDDYAAEAWDLLVNGVTPMAPAAHRP